MYTHANERARSRGAAPFSTELIAPNPPLTPWHPLSGQLMQFCNIILTLRQGGVYFEGGGSPPPGPWADTCAVTPDLLDW
jgi:hypothetical protein